MPNTITGTVTDPGGRPVAGSLVTLVERDTRNGTVRFHPVSAQLRVPTNERGQYRIEHARLGQFFVVAIPQNPIVGADGRVNRAGYRITYHPSAARAADAVPVTVNVRAPSVADIRLIAAPLSVVSGSVTKSNGSPAAGGTLAVAIGDNLFGIGGKGMRIRPDGSFVLPALPPGTYFLHYRESAWPPPRDEIPLISAARVVLDGKDIAGVKVAPIHMVEGSGRVIIDPALRARLDPKTTVGAAPVDFEGNPGPQRAGVLKEDLTFAFKTWPGLARVRVLPEPLGVRMKVRYQGADVTDTGIDFKEGTKVSGIEIELVSAASR